MEARSPASSSTRSSCASQSCHLGVVVSTIPWLEKRHVVPRLDFHGPGIIWLLRLTQDESEGGAEFLDGERSHLDAIVGEFSEPLQPAITNLKAFVVIERRASAEIVDPGFQQLALFV